MMATKLETIPEETTAPATPVRVTTDPPKTKPATEKNPGRVAAGKRLAQYNRQKREEKKQAESQKATAATSPTQSSAATPTQSGDANTQTPSKGSNTIVTILGVGGLIVSALGVYCQREAIMKRLGRTATPAPAPEPAAPPTSKIPVFRKME